MGKQQQISPSKRSNILLLLNIENNTLSQISTKLHISKSAVSRILKLHNETGSVEPLPRSGRPTKICEHTRRRMRRIATADPFATSTDIRQDLPELHNVSRRTINDTLKKSLKLSKLSTYKPRAKPRMTRDQLRKRLQFCHRVKNYSANDWNNIMWSDESTFELFHTGKQYVRRPRGSSPYDPRYTTKTIKHPPSNDMGVLFSIWPRWTLLPA